MHIDSRHETDMTAQGWLLAAVQPRSLPMASNLSTESAEVGADVPGASIAAAKRMHVQSNTDAGGRFSARAVVNELGVAAAERGDDAQYGPSGKARLGISNRATANLTPTKAGQEQTDTPNAKAFAADSSAATAEQSTLSKLEARDRQVKDREAAQGQAVPDAAYIYQTGPDGKRYAIGTRPHLVRKGGEEDTAGAESAATNATGLPPAENKLSAEQRQDLDRLQARDKEVRNHEQAHLTAAGGRAAGGPEYTYQKGPDGKQYAVGGSVHVSLESGSGDPDADMRNARAVQRAALAPAGPSGQDAIVAAKAGQTLARAAAEAAESPESSTGATDEELSPASQAGASSATSAQEEHGVGLGVNVSDAGSNPKNLRNLQAYGNAASPEQSFFQSIA